MKGRRLLAHQLLIIMYYIIDMDRGEHSRSPIVMPRAYVADLITANEYTKDTAKFLLYQDKYCHQRCSTESRIQRNTKDQFDVISKFLEHVVG